jgi:hypothetical protein
VSIQRERELLAERGAEKQAHGKTAPGKTLLSKTDKSDRHDTRAGIAKELGWSPAKVARADYVEKHGTDVSILIPIMCQN